MPTIHKTIQKVREFVLLPPGWHFGDGVPTPHERVEQAIRFLLFASQRGLDRANAFPGVTGQVEVTFYDGDRMLEVTIESDGANTIAEDRGSEQIYFEENRTKNDVYRRLEEFSQSIWPSSDLFIVSTTTQNVRVPVSQAWLSTSEPENRFPLLILTAPEPKAVPSVLIFQGTTMSSLEPPYILANTRCRYSRWVSNRAGANSQ